MCNRTQFHFNQPATPLRYCSYSDIVQNPDHPASSHDIESTSIVPGELDTMRTESSKIQQPPSSPSLLSTHAQQGKEPMHYRMPGAESLRDPRELRRLMSTTSLRKRIGWFNPLQGVNPAYDMALEFLNRDRKQKIEAIQRLENRIANEIQRFHPARKFLLIIRWRKYRADTKTGGCAISIIGASRY
jgi:hypothetical protein